MSHSVLQNPRLVELLTQRAIDGLNSAERAELKQLLSERKYVDAGRFEYTAASLLLAGDIENSAEEMPDSLHDRLMAQAKMFSASMPSEARTRAPRAQSRPSEPRVISIAGRARSATPMPVVTDNAIAPPPRTSPSSSISVLSKAGWFAAAASVLIALIGWWPRIQPSEPVAQAPVVTTLEQERAQLLAQQGVMRKTWQTTQDPVASGVSGDVVWDQQTQQGYLRFRGLQANNTDEMQYQLWIFDGTRDDRYPIDGGVFDVPPGSGEVIIPITAKLQVRNPAMFAVTIEKPGGSVVSSRDRIVVVAPVAAG